MRTALSGVFDPLEPGLALPDRLDALERWEAAWREMNVPEPIASVNALVHVVSEPPIGYFGEEHVIAFGTGFGRPAIYSFLNLHTWSSSHTDVARWTTVEINNPDVHSFAFAPELDLSVAFLLVKISFTHRGFYSMIPLRIGLQFRATTQL